MKNNRSLTGSLYNFRPVLPAAVFFILFIFPASTLHAQGQSEKIKSSMQAFHQALVKKDAQSIDNFTHASLSYGHSNGWIESKAELIDHNKSGYLVYQSFREDSIQVSVSGKVSYIRFVADIRSSMNNAAPKDIRLKVVEVWVMDKKDWKILVRQAVR
ncbi:MAG TPA: nuclear transport factor 2 family protein [Cyclobacteriaceae bacterium]|nr:nuclear transport factor 2 family protein [Cyclobacteriaceae bacterium]